MRFRRVLGFRPRRSAACPRPSIVQRQRVEHLDDVGPLDVLQGLRGAAALAAVLLRRRRPERLLDAEDRSCERIMARSMTFCSSRTFPGHS